MVDNGPLQQQLPYVSVVTNPSKANPTNPSGIGIGTNIAGKQPELVMIQILCEAIRLLSAKLQNVSASIVMPDGSAWPLPEKEAIHEESR